MGAVVRELYVFRQRGQPGEAVESAWFRRGIGMEGDRHAAGGERQTSLLAGEARDWMEKQTEPGLCFRRYKANLITEGICMHPPGLTLRPLEQVVEQRKGVFGNVVAHAKHIDH